MRPAISRCSGATDRRFALIGAHQRSKAVWLMNKETRLSITPYWRGECRAVYQAPAPHNTCGSCWLGTAQQFYHDMRGEGRSRVSSRLKEGTHIHQPTAKVKSAFAANENLDVINMTYLKTNCFGFVSKSAQKLNLKVNFIKFANVFAEVVAPVVSRSCFKLILWMKKLKTVDREIISWKFCYSKTKRLIL